MKKILLASPIRGGVSSHYVSCLMAAILANWQGRYSIKWAATSGTSVALARDELADVFKRQNFDRLVFWDVDLVPEVPTVFLSMLERLLSHDVDIVAAQYVGHKFPGAFHGAVADDGAVPRADGLLPMAQIPLGFSAITKEAFAKIEAAHPYLRYQFRQTEDKATRPNMFEFFPTGIDGPCSGQGKVNRIRDVLKNYGKHAANFSEYLEQIHVIVNDDRYESNILLGEDYFFCKLARDAGIPLYIDNNVIVPHLSHIRLPVANSALLASLGEEWRYRDNVMISEVEHLIEGVRGKMTGDHV